MALQNRVTPLGEIVATPERGTLMGNRGGCFHDSARRLGRRRWTSARWIACLLQYRGWHREVMTPGRYTELFFLDEATAFAAGHRPCALCRRPDFRRFLVAWAEGNGPLLGGGVDAVDRVLHGERRASAPGRPLPPADLARLPDGAFVVAGDDPAVPLLWQGGRLLRWTAGGYLPGPRATPPGLRLVTPPSLVRALVAGYAPGVHDSAASR
ncbi:MAG: hypothetical protein IT304_04790 [Dehalococcoidia bacterium]|nr:hypothetical protein [Dehalococcoidia bacterium]